MESFTYILGVFLGAIFGFYVGAYTYLGEGNYEQGAIAAHKGEIVCVQLAFKEERWECGEL